MPTKEEIAWVAGFLEGEGYFGISNGYSARIYVNQTDKDVVEKLRDIMSPDSNIGMQERGGNRQTIYRFWLYGSLAVEWMKLILPLMGIRRSKTINEVIEIINTKGDTKRQIIRDNKVISILMKSKNISRLDAIKLLEDTKVN